MKLDNRGWGYRDMIVYSSIIIICLVIVVVFCSVMRENMKSSSYEKQDKYVDKVEVVHASTPALLSYYEWEKEMQNATFTYLQKNNYNTTNQVRKIDLETLVGFGYMQLVRDLEDGSVCKGYSQIVTMDQTYTVTPYLKCTHYVTNGYEE